MYGSGQFGMASRSEYWLVVSTGPFLSNFGLQLLVYLFVTPRNLGFVLETLNLGNMISRALSAWSRLPTRLKTLLPSCFSLWKMLL